MSAQESMEQADQAKEASSENRKIALLIAVIALCLALSETLGKGAQTESISKNVESSNLWAFFQAKSIRRTVVQTAAEQSKLSLGAVSDEAAKAAVQKQIDDWQKTAARYRSEPETGEGQEQLSERAKHAEEERDHGHAEQGTDQPLAAGEHGGEHNHDDGDDGRHRGRPPDDPGVVRHHLSGSGRARPKFPDPCGPTDAQVASCRDTTAAARLRRQVSETYHGPLTCLQVGACERYHKLRELIFAGDYPA